MHKTATLTFLLITLSSCGGMKAGEFCEELASTLCDKTYGCLSDEELDAANMPLTEAACRAEYKAELGCPEIGDDECGNDEKYDSSAASECITELESGTCNEWRSEDIDDIGPTCNSVCQ